MRYHYYTADVFTDQPFGGNPLAVFPDARGLSAQQMQRIAAEFNYSESTFVFPPDDQRHTRRVRIFTPSTEMTFAGHPTVGTAHVLAATGDIPLIGAVTRVIFEEGVGPVPVAIYAQDGKPVFSQLTAAKLPEFGPPAPPVDVIAGMLSINAADIMTGVDFPQSASCGVPYLFVPLRSIDAVRRVRLNHPLWEKHFASLWARWIYLFSYEVERAGSHLHARMFAPSLGISEDPATGSAASALGGYLGVRDPRTDDTLRWRVEQGFEMGRPSILEVESDKVAGAITAVRVGGASVLMAEGWLEVPRD